MILVVGATGMLGSEICRQLSDAGEPVGALVRESSMPEKIKKLKDLGVAITRGDLLNRQSVKDALKNVTRVITTISAMPFSYVPGVNDIRSVDLEGMKNLIDSSVDAGVEHFIYTSFSRNLNVPCPLVNAKREVEKHLVKSGMRYTILRPGCFMELWLTQAVGFDTISGKINLCGDGSKPVSYISFYDVAKFAVQCLSNESSFNAVIELGGPEKLSQLEAVSVFESVTGRKFEVQAIPVEALRAQYNSAVDPMQKSFAGLMLSVASGDAIDMKDTLSKFRIKLKTVREHAAGRMN